MGTKKTLIKLRPDGIELNYGLLTDEEIAQVLKGFTKDPDFGWFEKKGIKSIYLVLDNKD